MLKSHVKVNTRHCLTQARKLLKDGEKGITGAFSGAFVMNYQMVMEGLEILTEMGRREWSGKGTPAEIAQDEAGAREQGNI